MNSLPKKIHLLGIAGAGMTALALLLREKGYDVTGSDPGVSTELQEKFRQLGIEVFSSEKPEHVQGKDLVVISSAIRGDHPELRAAFRNEVPIWHRVDLLARLTEGRKLLAVAGTHGKGTTAGMLAHILESQKLSPSLANGADLLNYDKRAWWGKGEFFIMETDESDGSFLKLRPWAAIITNIDRDHLNFWGNIEGLRLGFQLFASSVQGPLVVNDEIEETLRLGSKETVTYGEGSGSAFQAVSLKEGEEGTKVLIKCKTEKFEFFLPLWGRHNALNAIGAIALASLLGISPQNAIDAICSFKGIRRRLERKGEIKGFLIVDDHADHPTEIARSIAALLPLRRSIVAIVQPHRFSRVRALLQEYGPAFAACRMVVVLPIFAAGETLSFQMTGKEICDVICRRFPEKEVFFSNEEEIFTLLKMKLQKGDVILFLGPGDIAQIADQVFGRLHE